MHALVQIKGKQHKVQEGETIRVDVLGDPVGAKVEFTSVLMLRSEQDIVVGAPYVEGAKVVATVGEEVKGKKLRVFKRKRKKGYSRTQGHRQSYSLLTIETVSGG